MKSVTLTKSMREDILQSVMEKWMEGNQKPELKQAEHNFAMYIWNDYFKKEKKSLEKMPKEFMRKTDHVKVCVNGEVDEFNFLEGEYMPRNWDNIYCSPVLKTMRDNNKEYCKYKKILDAVDEWESLGDEIKRETGAILESVNTTKQLLELWPQCEPFLPAHVADPDKAIRLPAITMSRLNERIGLK